MTDTGFIVLLTAGGLYGVLHSLAASHRAKNWAQRAFGMPAYRRGYRLFFSIFGALTLLPILALLALLPDRTLYLIPSPWRWITLALQGAALLGMSISVLQTGALRFIGLSQVISTSSTPAAQPERLVTGGLYAHMRHPIYFFTFILLWLMPVMTWNLLALTLAFTLYLWIGAYYFEEPKLLEQFGAAYAAYRSRTPMIFPNPFHHR